MSQNTPRNSHSNGPKVDLVEVILNDIGGTFKKFQIINFILFALPFALSGSFGVNYVFTAFNVEHRCLIPECDDLEASKYNASWLSDAIPFDSGKPSKCLRYASVSNTSWTLADTCSASFNHSDQLRCNQYVYKTDEVSIVNGLHLECDKDLDWKIAMVGTANNLGRFVLMPLMGMLSDRLGRRTIVIVGVLGSSIFGILRSFATNYFVYVLFEFLDAGVGSVTYSASFILALEWVGVKDRILLSSLFVATYPFGQIFLGFVAKAAKDYRRMLHIIYAPGFLIIFYIWISSESIRWLIVNRKRERIFSIINRAEKLNGLKLSQDTIDRINVELNPNETRHNQDYKSPENKWQQFRQILTKRTFILRFLICAFAWFTNAFVTYGISLTSVALAGDKYINFVVIAIACIPAMLFVYLLMESLGRRWTISVSLMIGGISIIASKLLPHNFNVLSITFFFIGKCFITVSFTGLYVFTSELWPTNIRNSMMGFCSTVGRIGAALAPMAPLLGNIFEILPYLTFGIVSVIAAVLVLYLPETLRRKLPDSISEAEEIGRNESVSETS